jgi:pimeloyl-ACP methyl ester carboxylesterase
VFGSGPAVIVVHGTLGNWRQLLATARDLAVRRTVVLVSRPGYGSTPLASGASYEEQASLHAALLDRLGLEGAALLGVSAGAPSCLAFARAFPHRCLGLVLCGALAPHLASTRGMWATDIPGVVRVWVMFEDRRRSDALRRPGGIGSYLRSQLTEVERLKAVSGDVAADLRDFVRWTAADRSGVAGLKNDIRNIRQAHRTTPRSPHVVARALLLHGDRDMFVPVDHARHYESVIGGAVLELIPGGGHLFLQVFRRETSARIDRFLEMTSAWRSGSSLAR